MNAKPKTPKPLPVQRVTKSEVKAWRLQNKRDSVAAKMMSPVMDEQEATWADAQRVARRLAKKWRVAMVRYGYTTAIGSCADELEAAFKIGGQR